MFSQLMVGALVKEIAGEGGDKSDSKNGDVDLQSFAFEAMFTCFSSEATEAELMEIRLDMRSFWQEFVSLPLATMTKPEEGGINPIPVPGLETFKLVLEAMDKGKLQVRT